MNTPTLLQGMPWVPHDQTDITETWRRHGWKPSHELTAGIGDIRDDYETTDHLGYLEQLGAFK